MTGSYQHFLLSWNIYKNIFDYGYDFCHFPQNRGQKILKLKKHVYTLFVNTIDARNLKFGQVGVLSSRKKRYVGILPILGFYPIFAPLNPQKLEKFAFLGVQRGRYPHTGVGFNTNRGGLFW